MENRQSLEKRAVLLVAEPDEQRRQLLDTYLTREGYEVHRSGDAQRALEIFYDNMHRLHLVLLSTELKNPSGLEMLGEIRSTSDVPVMVCDTSRNDQRELSYFAQGADDYLGGYIEPMIVKAHIKAILRRSGVLRNRLECGALVLEMDSRKVFLEGEEIRMTPREFDLLEFLISGAGRVQTRETILLELWGYAYDGDIRTIDTLIKQLRKKLGSYGDCIKTVYGVGYLFEMTKK